MWEILVKMGVILRSDINNDINPEIAAYLKDMLYGAKTADDLIGMLKSRQYRLEINYDDLNTIPNEETAFAVHSINAMYDALKSGNTDLAYDIANVWQALSAIHLLSDKNSVDSFNSVYISNVNSKWKKDILPKLLFIRK